MWNYHEDKLSESVDFLKIGHHASHNATPWKYPKGDGEEHPINHIFDKLVPKDKKTTQVVISTERLKYPNIPDRYLLEALGERVLNPRQYDERVLLDSKELGGKWKKYNIDEEVVPKDIPQPLRTDLEYQHTGSTWEPWIDLTFKPKL